MVVKPGSVLAFQVLVALPRHAALAQDPPDRLDADRRDVASVDQVVAQLGQ
ncbi:hypothetical protein [Micromonospora sp. DPT]|uniref:hypothetical protein n=1 Tax=Micromonospora sp. DPT TaxID=3142975 RepID=UPI0032083B31